MTSQDGPPRGDGSGEPRAAKPLSRGLALDDPGLVTAHVGQGTLRRRLKYGAVAAYLAALALFPQWASLGFLGTPALEGEAELRGGEEERFQPVSWDVLGGYLYDFEVPGVIGDGAPGFPAQRSSIPPEVRALDRQAVAVRGYAIPIAMERGRITEFILAAKNEVGCCFGDGLAMNQWILVAVPEETTLDLKTFAIVTVLGVLEVGEEVREGVVLSLYRMREATVRSG